ncbi:hypothetical protein AH078_004540 [Salmonella enterica subsp. enterica serovar Ohio]|nr:hypothetical protein [Salmonella enterica subsp. enterica serovar Ohio]
MTMRDPRQGKGQGGRHRSIWRCSSTPARIVGNGDAGPKTTRAASGRPCCSWWSLRGE